MKLRSSARTFAVAAALAATLAGVAVGVARAAPAPSLGQAADVVAAAGSGAPPASFWGNTAAIPAAKKVLEVRIINRTNGRFANSAVFWSFNGTEKSIAQQQYIDMPANSSGRMYLYLSLIHI